jgi:benzoate membrane transport protein
VALAGIALMSTIGSGLGASMSDAARREPAVITFLVTASGVQIAGIGAAFWGIVAGIIASLVLHAPLAGAPALDADHPPSAPDIDRRDAQTGSDHLAPSADPDPSSPPKHSS